MPNNGIISRYASVPEEFKVNTTNDFDNTTDTIVVNKALNGIKVEQKAVTLNQLAGMVGGGSQGPQGIQGPQGPAGPAVPSGLSWQGDFTYETNYYLNDVVTWVNPDTSVLGSYWVNDTEVYDTPPTDNSGNINPGWAFLTSQGPQGLQGPEGPQGNVGPQGPAGVATLPYKEINFSVQPHEDFGPTPPNIIIGYSTFVGGLLASSENGNITISLTNMADYIYSPEKCIITVQTPINNAFNIIINSMVNDPGAIALRTLRQAASSDGVFSGDFNSVTTQGVIIYVNIKVYN